MSLFGKKKEEVKNEPTCACNGNAEVYEAEVVAAVEILLKRVARTAPVEKQ